jgi:eukaryotic-like serine/threonine-protein kinase
MSTHPTTIGKYTIERELGRGGMGVVYRALDPIILRPVALKTVVKSRLDPADSVSLLARFKREAQAAGRLVHPHIVSVYEYGEDAEYAYIAMEYVEGRGLNEFLSPNTPMEIDRARPVIAQMLDALAFAHAQGVVHRDVKPANVMMTTDWRVKVSDFGIAQIDASKLTQMGTVLGTPSYMSPEQFKGDTTDARADIFSAGVAIYEMLTGQKPFEGTTLGALAHAVLNTAPRPLSTIHPGLDTTLDDVVLKALSMSPSDRFPTAKHFAVAIDAAFEGRVVDFITDPLPDADQTVVVEPVGVAQRATPTPTPTPIRKIDFAAVTRKIDATTIRNVRNTLPGAAATAPFADVVRAKVLFVDDEERILSALRLLFKTQYDVHVTTDAAEALEWLKKEHFHVLVSDQRMPNMSGTELLSKAKVIAPNTVRILLTGYSDLAAIIGSINEGEVYRFANKPWNTVEIRTLLQEASAIGMALQDAPPPTIGAGKPDEAVLIVDDDREIYLAARDLFGQHYRVLHAVNLLDALDVLRDEKVGVLVADIEGAHQHNRTLFKLLKREHPQILTIAMTAASDSDLVIELINQAQIFRFLNKPLKLPTLQQHIAAAMAQFLKYQAQPKRLMTQKVDAPVAAKESNAEDASVGSLILGKLKALRARLTAS